MLHTSYFGGLRHLPTTIIPVAICYRPPHWFTGPNYKALAPSGELLDDIKSGRCVMIDYVERFQKETLDRLDPHQVIHELGQLSTTDIALCCYEPVWGFCHRFIVSDWFRRTLGLRVVEYGNHPIIFGG